MNMGLNWIDYSFLLLLLISITFGFLRGFIRGGVSLVFLILAVYLAIKYSPSLAARFGGSASSEQAISYLLVVGFFLLIFLLTIFIGALVSYLLNLAFQFGGLGFINRLLGGLFGVVQAVIITIMVIYIVQLTPSSTEPVWRESKVVMYFQPVTIWLEKNISPTIEVIKEKVNKTVENIKTNN